MTDLCIKAFQRDGLQDNIPLTFRSEERVAVFKLFRYRFELIRNFGPNTVLDVTQRFLYSS